MFSPFTIDSGGTTAIAVRVIPPAVGVNAATLTMTIDGDWLTPSDTLVYLSVPGVVCGTMFIDTMIADVGTRAIIRVRLERDERTAGITSPLTDLINTYGGNRTITLRADPSLLLFGTTIGGSLLGGSAVSAPGEATIRQTGAVVSSADFLTVPADVMLSAASRSTLGITVQDLVDGFYDVRVGPGLLIASYCAKDERLVQAGTAPLVWAERETILVYAQASSSYHVSIHSVDGRIIYDHTSTINVGETVRISVPHESSGTYYAVVTTARGSTVMDFVLYR